MNGAGYVLRDSTTGVPTYYSVTTGRNAGAGVHGWTQDKNSALHFARQVDAVQFARAFFPMMADNYVAVPI